MFDERTFDKEIDDLVDAGEEKKAEERLLKTYSEFKAAGSVENLAYVAYRLAHYYSTPSTENLEKAEAYFVEREALSPGAYAKCKTAWFYFYVAQNALKTIAKVDEIKPSSSDRDSYYSALTLKGQALIKLGMISDADRTLEELLSLIKTNPRGLPYGDEINLLQASVSRSILAPKCREILELIIPKIRSQEYQERAKALLKSGGLGDV